MKVLTLLPSEAAAETRLGDGYIIVGYDGQTRRRRIGLGLSAS